MKKTELKVSMNCKKCKSAVLKAVAKLEGVDQVTVDAGKGTVTVVGEVDPVCLTTKVRKTGNHVEITSVGPPKKPDPAPAPAPKPKPDADPTPPKPLPACCPQCQYVVIREYPYYDTTSCSIL